MRWIARKLKKSEDSMASDLLTIFELYAIFLRPNI